MAWVDVRDAAAGVFLAMHKGVSGERYLLNGSNMTLDAFLGRVARLAGVPTPRSFATSQAIRSAGRLVEALFRHFDAQPPMDTQSLEMAEHTWYVDASKAKSALGFSTRDPQHTLVDTVRDIKKRRGLLEDVRAV